MCGICGILHFDPERPVDPTTVERMAAVIHHRGPDGDGFHVDRNVGLGHKRLSIIDLSDAGRQPMSNEDGRLWIAFNGEIYNYRELRADLLALGHRFRSQTDTEVVLHLFEERGPAAVEQLNGMFAFVVWDARQRTLFAARDRFGIKPFYYALADDSFVFGSEIKSILQSQVIAPDLNRAALADYLTFQFTIGSKTLFRGVERLEPGHWLRIGRDGRLDIGRYWDVDFTVDEHQTETDFRERLDWLLRDAIKLELRSDVPVGAHLSGGLDSTTVTCLAAAEHSGAFHTFSGGFREGNRFDETAFARSAAAAARTTHHEIFPTAADFVELMPSLVYAMDEPAAGPGLFPQFLVSRLARDHVKVVLGGQGGDEVFGGYTRYLIAYLEACIKGGIESTSEDERYVVTFESILPNLPQLKGYEPLLRRFWSADIFDSPERRYFRLIDRGAATRPLLDPAVVGDLDRDYDVFEEFRGVFDHPDCHALINRMTRFDLKTLLPALLQVEDRTSMAVSLESRVPLLDHRIVELVAAMPPKIKFKGGRTKHIFREVVRPIVPSDIYDRTDKMGFPVPLTEWARCGPVREFLHDTLLGSRARGRGLFKTGQVETALAAEREYDRGVWGLLCLELWCEAFLDQQVTNTVPVDVVR
jgi:asparagine synthase (glutamine-hydrolysing)